MTRTKAPEHGYERYSNSRNPCRCDVCKQGKADYVRSRRQQGLEPQTTPPPPVKATPRTKGQLPCHMDNRFISDKAKVLREAARECAGCPVLDDCRAAGIGEPTGVWGGTVPTDEVRRLARKTYKGAAVCRNGHDVEEHGYPVDNLFPEHNNTPIMGCGVCVDRRRSMSDGLEASA